MSTRNFIYKSIVVVLQVSIASPSFAALTVMADLPLDTKLSTTNSIMMIDNSGSMDYEVLRPDIVNGTFSTSGEDDVVHLFPSEEKEDGRYKKEFVTIAPTLENAFYRSHQYNIVYYNPNIDYNPWGPAYIKGPSLTTFPEATPSAARYHPYFNKDGNVVDTPTGSAQKMNLTIKHTNIFFNVEDATTQSRVNSTFVSDSASSGKKYYDYFPATYWLKDETCTTPGTDRLTAECATAIDGKKLRRYDIKNSSIFNGSSFTLPDGKVIYRTRDEEMQNFANWFTYARKYKLLFASGMGSVIGNLQSSNANMRIAVPVFNKPKNTYADSSNSVDTVTSSNTTLVLYDFTSSDKTKNGYAALGKIYSLVAMGGTPTNDAMKYAIGRYGSDALFNGNDANGVELLRCSKNTTFIVTDGYAGDYSSSSTDNLYTKAKAAYDKFPTRAWYKNGTENQTFTGNTINTYAISLGAPGNIFTKIASPTDADWSVLYNGKKATAPVNKDYTAIDDLFRATKATEGSMLIASDPNSLNVAMNAIIRSMFKTTAHTNVPVSQKYLQNNTTAVVATFNTGDWTSDIKSHPVNNDINNPSAIGTVDTATVNWSVKAQLDARDHTTRRIVTFNPESGKGGLPFTVSALTDSKVGNKPMKDAFNTSNSNKDGADVINYLRGDRSKEGTSYNARGGLLGDIVNSSPIIVSGAATAYDELSYKQFAYQKESRQKMVYVGANDGMLHAFNADTGVEEWAYVPQMLHSTLNADSHYVRLNYNHKFYVDGPLTAWDVKFDDNAWHTLLVGGLRSGGKGYFAIDITTPPSATSTEQDIANNIKWEISNNTAGFANLGYSFGKPVIAKTKSDGWVVLLSSGYNNADGKAHLYVVKAETGELLQDISTADFGYTDGSAADPLGMAQIGTISEAAPDPDTNGVIRFAYAGDLKGNVWKFDLSGNNKNQWSVTKFAEKLGLSGSGGRAITTAPAVGFIDTKGSPNPVTGDPLGGQLEMDTKDKRLMVFVGTGKIMDSTDLTNTTALTNNGFFAMEDFIPTSTLPKDPTDNAFVYGKGACANFSCLRQVGLQAAGSKSNDLNNWIAEKEESMQKWWISGQYDKTSYCSAGESCGGFSFNDAAGRKRSGRGWYIPFSETGNESVIQDPLFAYGFVTFVTSMKSDARHGSSGVCETTYSAEYVLGATKGGTLPSSTFLTGESAWSRKNLNFGIASFQTLVVGGDSWVRAIVNTGGKTTTDVLPGQDSSCKVANSCGPLECAVTNTCPAPTAVPTSVPSSSSSTLRRWGWKEVVK